MTREAVRRSGISVLAVIGLIHAAQAGPGNGPPGGGQGFGGPGSGGPPGGYGAGFPSSGPRNPGYPPDRSDDYDYSGPSFNFSVRKTRHAGEPKDDAKTQDPKTQDPKTPPANSNDNDIWQRFRSGFGLFGSGN